MCWNCSWSHFTALSRGRKTYRRTLTLKAFLGGKRHQGTLFRLISTLEKREIQLSENSLDWNTCTSLFTLVKCISHLQGVGADPSAAIALGPSGTQPDMCSIKSGRKFITGSPNEACTPCTYKHKKRRTKENPNQCDAVQVYRRANNSKRTSGTRQHRWRALFPN